MNVEGWVGNLVNGLEVTIDFGGNWILENVLQNILEYGQLVGIVGQTEFARVSPSRADDVIHSDQCGLRGDVQHRCFDVSRVSTLWIGWKLWDNSIKE